MIRYPASVWLWLVLAGVFQPFAMEAYNLAGWYWADPMFVRLITITGPFVVICALSLRPINEQRIWTRRLRSMVHSSLERSKRDAHREARRQDLIQGLAMTIAVILWAAPWSVIGLDVNWGYRCAFLALQIQMAAMWWLAMRDEPANWLLEVWSRRVGFGFACLGILPCIAFQFVWPETPLLGVMPDYDVARETSSAMVQATGLSTTVWAMPLASLTVISLLAGADAYRRSRRKLRLAPDQTIAMSVATGD